MSGLLNKVIATGAIQEVAEVPGTGYAAINVLLRNRTASAADALIWIGTGATPSDVDEVDEIDDLPAKGGYEMTARVCSGGEKVFVRATAGVVIRVEFIEEQ